MPSISSPRRSAPRSSRLALSLLLRRRNVSSRDALRAARRRLGRDAVQPRPAPARARPCPPGHHRVRPRPAHARLEPRLRRSLRASRRTSCASASALTRSSRFNAERGSYGPGPVDELIAQRIRCFVARSRAAARPPPSVGPRHRDPLRTGCRTAASSRPIPTSPRPSPRRRRASARTRPSSSASASARRN